MVPRTRSRVRDIFSNVDRWESMAADMEPSAVWSLDSLSLSTFLCFRLLPENAGANRYRRQRKQAKVPPVLLSPSGLAFERIDLIKVFARTLPVLQTEECVAGNAGWISNPQSAEDAQWWADLLQRKFLLVVQAYVVGEAHLEGSHSEAAIMKDLHMNSPFLTADNIRFPPVKAESDIDLEYFGKSPFLVLNASDGASVAPTSCRNMTFTDLAN